MLGPISVWDEQGNDVAVPGVKVRALLAILLIHRGHVVSSDRLVEALWGENAPADAAAVLRTKVTQLRRVIDQAGGEGRQRLMWRAPGYVLEVEPQSVDYEVFAAGIQAAREQADPHAQVEFFSSALTGWHGEALGEFRDAMFAKALVVRLDELWIEAMEARSQARLELGDPARTVSDLEHLRDRFPWRENLHCLLMKALYQLGRQHEALDVYAQLTTHLRDELGLDPGPQIAQLHQAILRQDVPDPPPAPPRPITRSAGNLPQPLTDLIGRDEELRLTPKLLDHNRLLTLFGPGGVGKTRLAIAIGHQEESAYPDGVWFIDLSSISPLDGQDGRGSSQEYLILNAIAEALGLRDDAASGANELKEPVSLRARIAAFLMTARSLLILDNAEHVLPTLASVIRDLMSSTVDVTFLVTSREPFRSPYEKLFPVPPLETPLEDVPMDSSDIGRFHSLSLFLRRCGDAGADIEPTPENVSLASAVCRKLDGLPLALELAAAKVPILGLASLLKHLDDRFRLLQAPRSGTADRHRTLRAVIDWSWDMLSEPEQVLLRRLALSAGGYPLEAIEDIPTFGDLDSATIVESLSRLVDQSLVNVCTIAGQVRYRLLESVSHYAYDKLTEAREFTAVARRHVVFFGQMLHSSTDSLRSDNQRDWLQKLHHETDNIRHSLRLAGLVDEPAQALRLASAWAWHRFLRGGLTEAQRALDAALTLASDSNYAGPEATEARIWGAAFHLRITSSQLPPSEHDLSSLLRPEPSDDRETRRARWFLAYSMLASRNHNSEASLVIPAALKAVDQDGDAWGSAAAAAAHGLRAFLNNNLIESRSAAQQAEKEFSRLGDSWGWLQANDVLSRIAESESDFAVSQALDRKGLQTAEALDLTSEYSRLLARMGVAALVTGHREEARDWFHRSRRLAGAQCDGEVCSFSSTGLRVLNQGITGPEVLVAMQREYVPFDTSLQYWEASAAIIAQPTE